MDRNELFEVVSKLSDRIDDIQDEANRIQRVLSKMRHDLTAGKDVGSLDTLFGITDLAGMVNGASRWEGRVWERLDAAYETECSEKAESDALEASRT